MGVVAGWIERRQTIAIATGATLAAYCAMVFWGVTNHEPWADEAQAWLLARDGSLVNLWTRLLRLEGSPGLWHTLLHTLSWLKIPYAGMSALAAAFGCAAAAILIWKCPLPLPVRLLLPFTYFLAFQYTLVARSYSLLPPLIFACAAFRNKAGWIYLALLILLADVSLHGLVLSVAIWLSSPARVRRPIPLVVYLSSLALVACAIWPATDGTFITQPTLLLDHFVHAAQATLSESFTGEWISSLTLAALSFPFLIRGGAIAPFALSVAGLLLVNGLIYSQVWHQGLLFLAWIFALWVAANRTKLTPAVYVALVVVITLQCYWTVRTWNYDRHHLYSGSQEAASFLRRQHIPSRGLFGIGYACVAVQPYFDRNIFSNWRTSYWDWSKSNHIMDEGGQVEALRPEYVLVGYKSTLEKNLWTARVRNAGYERIGNFEGSLFWKDRVFEPDSFELFRRLP